MKEWEKELLAVLKKHGVTSFGMLCYNDPDKVKELKAFDYESDLISWYTQRDAELGASKEDLTVDLYTESCGYTPGLWYSSRC